MSFTSYEETRPWARAIAHKVEAREMPPWFASAPTGVFSNERGLSGAEIDTILSWVDAGAPAGDAADAPAPRQWVEEASDGWSVGTPDFTFKMSEPYFVEDDIYDLNISFFKTLTEEELTRGHVGQGLGVQDRHRRRRPPHVRLRAAAERPRTGRRGRRRRGRRHGRPGC